jgi:transcriptional regulator with XRE-family HTH domain
MNQSNRFNVQKVLGRRIGALREEKGFTQPDLANRCGLPEREIKAIENGDVDLPLNTLIIVASTLEVTISSLFHELA